MYTCCWILWGEIYCILQSSQYSRTETQGVWYSMVLYKLNYEIKSRLKLRTKAKYCAAEPDIGLLKRNWTNTPRKREKAAKISKIGGNMLLLSAMALGLVVDKTSTDLKVTRDAELLVNDTHKSTGPGDWTIEHCTSWHRPNHLYYQLGNAFFFLAFVAPHGSYGMLWLRCSLVIGCILLTMWGWIIECTGDVVLWSSIFLATNLVYLVILLCRLRPVRFEKEIESVSCLTFFLLIKTNFFPRIVCEMNGLRVRIYRPCRFVIYASLTQLPMKSLTLPPLLLRHRSDFYVDYVTLRNCLRNLYVAYVIFTSVT